MRYLMLNSVLPSNHGRFDKVMSYMMSRGRGNRVNWDARRRRRMNLVVGLMLSRAVR
jgi:hypothetical protein